MAAAKPSSLPGTRVLMAALGVAVLVVAYYFSIPEPRQDLATATTPAPEKISALEPTLAPPADAEELAPPASAVLLPDMLQRLVARVREKGDNPWWADAIEAAYTSGFPAAVEILRQSMPPDRLDERIANLLSLLAQERLEFLIDGLPMIHGAQSPFTVASGPINSWARKDPTRLAAFAFEHLDGNIKTNALDSAVKELAKKGRFVEAESVLNKLPQSEKRTKSFKTLAADWGRQDIEGAIAWARGHSSPADQLDLEKSAILAGAYKLTLQQARDLATGYATEQTRPFWDSVIGGKVLEGDTEAAIALARTLPDESRRKLQTRIAPKLAQTDLARGTAFALQIDNESSRISAIDAIHHQLTQKSTQAAIDWTWTLPEDLQKRVVVGIVTQWYREDEAATKAWVASLPQNAVRDRAATRLAWEVARGGDRAGAEAIANGINDSESKASAFKFMPKADQ